ncbi:MAG TPA: ATP-binding protein [Noviherbaspirillum sp.]|uniref:ATP-binding protein n=1 Tax=Noviherbaspirillum sp. TaxID=1926288 RepID=UPI002DDD7860|nr:ATP-binding protein [Noviherbaspirillum sp.]HEV2611355.1 ATP-binding protein [Noviherbaspirillum sp.]
MNSIRVKLSVYLLLAAMFTAVVVGAFTYRQTLKQNEDLFDYQLRQIALSLRDHGFAERPASTSGDRPDVVVQIWTMRGTIAYLSDPSNPVPDRATPGFTNMDAKGRRWRVYALPGEDQVIQVAQPFEQRRDLAARAALRSLLPLLAFAPVMAILIWWLVGQSLSALTRLSTELRQRDAASLNQVSVGDVPAEISPLVSSLNMLLDKLKRALANQRAFVADAAHELRSPLTALKLQLQLLQRAPDEIQRDRAFSELNQGVDRATHLIEQLLAAARTDPSDTAVTRLPVDLAELVRRVIGDLFALAQARDIDIALDTPEQVTVEADAPALRILARNLLDNAIRYTPRGGNVLVSISPSGEGIRLTVDDSGPGIPEPERERVFDRFYRREVDGQTGTGLGMSIVRNIVDQHGGRVELADSPLGGLRAVVMFSR